MIRRTRRHLLQATSGIVAGTIAGCIGAPNESVPENQTTSGNERTKSPIETTAGDDSLTDWERSTDCEGEEDGMHDSVVKVEGVRDSIGQEYDAIHFSDLTSGERDIVCKVTEEGGYGTCDASDAFDRFVDRVSDRRQRQDKDGVYLERDDTYYRLYVEKLDQVYAH